MHSHITYLRPYKFVALIKVGKSQKHFFLKLLPKKRTKYLTKFCSSIVLSNISFIFWAMEFQEKMVLRFTDLYEPLDLKKVGTRHLDDKLIGSLAPLKCNSSYLISVRLLPKVKPFCALACNPEICKT